MPETRKCRCGVVFVPPTEERKWCDKCTQRQPFFSRFWSKVDKTGECWLWAASKDKRGYGQVRMGNRTMRSHRVAWFLRYGSLPPPDKMVCHSCDNPACVRPSHLFLGTSKSNIEDMDRKGRRVNHPHYGEDHGRAVLTEENVREIRARLKLGEQQKLLAKEFGVSKPTICAINTRRIWGWLDKVEPFVVDRPLNRME
jgi:hypothetical protein